jgi:hypothetical protein
VPASTDDSTTLPSPPAARLAVRRQLALLGGAVVVGLGLNHFVQIHLATLQVLAATDPIAARARFAAEIRVGGLGLFALTGLLGVAIIAAARRGIRELRFPPPGVWSWGGARTVTGAAVRPIALVVAILGALLIVCSLAGAALSWEMGTRLLACRAGVPPTH